MAAAAVLRLEQSNRALHSTVVSSRSGQSATKSSVQSRVEGLSSTVTSRRAGVNPNMSTCSVQGAQGRLLNVAIARIVGSGDDLLIAPRGRDSCTGDGEFTRVTVPLC